MGVCVIIWFILNERNIPVENVSFNYKKITQDKQIWRLISSQYSHYSVLHCLFNIASLWSYGYLEESLGQVIYLKYTFLLLILSFVLCMIAYKIIIDYGRLESYREQNAIGYSCVVFGWMTLGALQNPSGRFQIFGFGIPILVIPFMALVMTQIIVPNASFVGHLAGIVAAFAVHFKLFFWLLDPIFFALLVIFIALMSWNYYKTRSGSISGVNVTPGDADHPANQSVIGSYWNRFTAWAAQRWESLRGSANTTTTSTQGRRLGDGTEEMDDLESGQEPAAEPNQEGNNVRNTDNVPLLQQGTIDQVDNEPHTQVILPPEEEVSNIKK